MSIDEKAVEAKIAEGKPLTKEETQFVMSYPNDDITNQATDDDIEESFANLEGVEDKAAVDEAEETPESGEKQDKTETVKAKTETPKAETSKAPEPKKKDEVVIDYDKKVEADMALPDEKVDVTGLSKREEGLYWSLRKERKARQKAEEDRDVLIFEEVKKRKAEDTLKAQESAEESKPKRDPEDFLTVRELEEERRAQEVEMSVRERNTLVKIAELNARDIIDIRREKDPTAPSYDDVMIHANTIIDTNEDYKKQIWEAFQKGKNPAIVTYNLIVKDPKFVATQPKPVTEEPAKQSAKTEEARKTLDKINANEAKPKTSGAQGGNSSDDKEPAYTLEQLANMSSFEFRQVPKKVRDAFLKSM